MMQGAPDLANLPLNCPKCGRPMRYVRARTLEGDTVADQQAANESTVYIYRCAEHGPFQFSPDIPVRPGS